MEEICSLKVRLALRVTPKSLILLDRINEVPVTSTQVMRSREEFRWDGPKRIASSRFIASQLCEN